MYRNIKNINEEVTRMHQLMQLNEGISEDVNKALLREGIKDMLSKLMPKVKDAGENTLQKTKEIIANTQGFVAEEWDDPENQKKLAALGQKLKTIFTKLKDGAIDTMGDKEKLRSLITTLDLGKYLALISGIVQVIFSTGALTFVKSIVLWATGHGSAAAIGGLFFFKLALFLFILQIIIKIIYGTQSLKDTLGGMVSFITDTIKLFTDNNSQTELATNEDEALTESVFFLFEKYGYNDINNNLLF